MKTFNFRDKKSARQIAIARLFENLGTRHRTANPSRSYFRDMAIPTRRQIVPQSDIDRWMDIVNNAKRRMQALEEENARRQRAEQEARERRAREFWGSMTA